MRINYYALSSNRIRDTFDDLKKLFESFRPHPLQIGKLLKLIPICKFHTKRLKTLQSLVVIIVYIYSSHPSM